jgi:hypothetical protein
VKSISEVGRHFGERQLLGGVATTDVKFLLADAVLILHRQYERCGRRLDIDLANLNLANGGELNFKLATDKRHPESAVQKVSEVQLKFVAIGAPER